MSRPSRAAVEQFLLGSLAPAMQKKYQAALELLQDRCVAEGVVLETLCEEELDWFLAEVILHGYQTNEMRYQIGCLLSALARINPRMRLKVAWRVPDVWTVRDPPTQAAACPPEILVRMFMLLILGGRPLLGVGFMPCYAGLLRVREMLNLTGNDIVMTRTAVILCLGHTKRGREQKVVCSHPQTVKWMVAYVAWAQPSASERVFNVGYTSCLKWIRRAASAAGVGDLNVSTHSLRRSGASELSRMGVPWANVMDDGRWSTDRAAPNTSDAAKWAFTAPGSSSGRRTPSLVPKSGAARPTGFGTCSSSCRRTQRLVNRA